MCVYVAILSTVNSLDTATSPLPCLSPGGLYRRQERLQDRQLRDEGYRLHSRRDRLRLETGGRRTTSGQ